MEDYRDTPPYSGPHTPQFGPTDPNTEDAETKYASPISMASDPTPQKPKIPRNLTQAEVNANPELKRFQQDLLILTSFNETETIHWRPSWFKQEPYCKSFWTLYNPPNVVTEKLPHRPMGRIVYTRRMRQPEDPFPPPYQETWDAWYRICDLYGIPYDFLCEEQIELMRLGLPRNSKGVVCIAPNYPLYPEPQPRHQGRYILTPSVYTTHLPPKFHNLTTEAPTIDHVQVIVVHSNGALVIDKRENLFQHRSQWTHYSGTGGYRADANFIPDFSVPKDQSKGRRWSYLPWTKEMEESCKSEGRAESGTRKLTIKLRGWNSAMQAEDAAEETRWAKEIETVGERVSEQAVNIGI